MYGKVAELQKLNFERTPSQFSKCFQSAIPQSFRKSPNIAELRSYGLQLWMLTYVLVDLGLVEPCNAQDVYHEKI